MPEPTAGQKLTDTFIKQLDPEQDQGDDSENENQGELEFEEEGAEESDDDSESEAEESEGSEGDEEEEGEIASHISPPSSMSAEETTHFQSLSPEMQEFVVRREADRDVFFQRTQNELATERKQIEAIRNQATEQLNSQASSLSQFVTQDVAPPDVALRAEDPDKYDDQMAAYVHGIHQQKQAQTKLDEIKNVQNAELVKFQDQQAVEVARMIPEITDPVKGPQIQSQIRAYAQTVGFSSEQLSGASARDAVVLYKAMLYDERVSSGRIIAKKSPKKAAPKSAKPGASKGVSRASEAKIKALRKRLRGGDDRAAVDLFQMALESEGR